jgi:hypothetical protein
MLQLEPVQEAGAVTAAAVQLRLPDKPSVLWGTLLLELAAVRSASTLPGVLGGCPPPCRWEPSTCCLASLATAHPELSSIVDRYREPFQKQHKP